MTLVTADFEEMWMHLEPQGWRYSAPGQEEVLGPLHLHVEIDAANSKDWDIEAIYAVYVEVHPPIAIVSEEDLWKPRTTAHMAKLEGDEYDRARKFLESTARYADAMQVNVDQEFPASYARQYAPVRV
jgi:hypothetical protein